MSKVTSLDVARMAGVSQSAVSRVFTPGASASKATAEKVKDAAEKLGYRPNPIARAMITGKSRIIGLLVAYLDNQFYPVAIERLSKALQDQGYHILIFMTSNDEAEVDKVVQELLDYRVDGIIMASVGMSNSLTDRCAAAGIPVVMFNRGQDGSGLSTVTSANIEGGRKAAEFFCAAGHTRIAHVAGWQGASTGRDRRYGFEMGLTQLEVAPVAIVEGMYNRDIAAEVTRSIMAEHNPDAIFVGNDHMAFAVMDVIRNELGLSIPDDVSIIGYDDVPQAGWAAYDLTTVRQPVNRMVEATVDTILGQIETPGAPTQKTEIEGPLIVRGSARIPEGWTQ